MVGDRAIVAARLVAERAGNPVLADTGRADDQQVLLAVDPVAGGQLVEQRAVEAARRPQIDVLDDGLLPQGGEPQAGDQPLVLALGRLAVEQQRQPLLEGQRRDVGLSALIIERLGHAGQPEGEQAFLGWMSKHRDLLRAGQW